MSIFEWPFYTGFTVIFKLILSQISATMDGNSTVVSARENMWNDFWKYSNSFMDNILNIDAGELMSYMETLLKHMGENSLPTSTDR